MCFDKVLKWLADKGVKPEHVPRVAALIGATVANRWQFDDVKSADDEHLAALEHWRTKRPEWFSNDN